jgi:hypothetical protein
MLPVKTLAAARFFQKRPAVMQKFLTQLKPALHLLLAATLAWMLAGGLRAESVRRSDAETDGEKRLLEWDLNKTYDLSKSRTNPSAKAPSKSFITKIFGTGSFASKAFPAESFSSPEFLLPETRARTRAYAPAPSAPTVPLPASSLARPFPMGKSPALPKLAPSDPVRGTAVPRRFEGSDRPYLGPEAARKEQRYNPETAPKGGVIEGKRLTVEEVKEILNKSK